MDGDVRITVAGITFSAADVVSATIKVDGREVDIGKKDDDKKPIGFADCVSGRTVEPAGVAWDEPGDKATGGGED